MIEALKELAQTGAVEILESYYKKTGAVEKRESYHKDETVKEEGELNRNSMSQQSLKRLANKFV